jgi:hypothetical protein
VPGVRWAVSDGLRVSLLLAPACRYTRPMAERRTAPDGVRILADGSWTVAGVDIIHRPSLRYLKAHLVFEEEGVWLVEGARRLPVAMEGPAFEVTELRLDTATGEAWVTLDDGSKERLADDTLSLNERTSRVECLVRDGRARATLSRGAHQTLLSHIERMEDRFYLCVGPRRLALRT